MNQQSSKKVKQEQSKFLKNRVSASSAKTLPGPQPRRKPK